MKFNINPINLNCFWFPLLSRVSDVLHKIDACCHTHGTKWNKLSHYYPGQSLFYLSCCATVREVAQKPKTTHGHFIQHCRKHYKKYLIKNLILLHAALTATENILPADTSILWFFVHFPWKFDTAGWHQEGWLFTNIFWNAVYLILLASRPEIQQVNIFDLTSARI